MAKMEFRRQFALLAIWVIFGVSYNSSSQSQAQQFDEILYKRITGDIQNSMSAWHSGFLSRIVPVADDVVVEALNFYSYGNPSGPEPSVGTLTIIDTGWKNVGKCVYQRVHTQFNDKKNGPYTVHGRSKLISIDLSKIDWNSSTIKSEFNTLISKRLYKVTIAGKSNDFYKETANSFSDERPKSRSLIIDSTESTSTYEFGALDAPLDRIQKSLSLAKAQCGGIKSSF